jgi:hypothetical protein
MSLRPFFLVVLLAGACGPGDPEGPPDANPYCIEAANHDDLEWIQDNIFTPSCSRFSACHQRTDANRLPPEAAHLSLEPDDTVTGLVNHDSELYGPDGTEEMLDWKLVVPGDPVHSYLMVILTGEGGPISDKGTMPYNSPLLCQEMRDAIERWIESLAPDPDAGVPVDAGPPDAML